MVARARRLRKISLPIGEREQRVRIELAVLECRFRFCIIDRHARCRDRRGRSRRVARRLRPSRPEYRTARRTRLRLAARVLPASLPRAGEHVAPSTLEIATSSSRIVCCNRRSAIGPSLIAHRSSLITHRSGGSRTAVAVNKREARAASREPEPRVASRESRDEPRVASRESRDEPRVASPEPQRRKRAARRESRVASSGD